MAENQSQQADGGSGRRPLNQAQVRAGYLTDAMGSAAAVAELLNVSRSQLGEWRRGQDSPGLTASALIVDVDHVLPRASFSWPVDVAVRWLTADEPFLHGARPIDVLRTRGSRDVVEAPDAIVAGAYT